jgi:hypothetical protein
MWVHTMHWKDEKNCFLYFHSNEYSGLTNVDRQIVGIKKKEWNMWNDKQLENNKEHIDMLERQIEP